MRTFLRILAVLIVIPIVALLLVGLVTLDLRLTLLNPTFLEKSLVQQGIYNHLPQLMVDVMFEQMTRVPTGEEGEVEEPEGPQGADIAAELEEKFGREALEDFIAALVPPTWVRQQVEHNIEALFAWLEGETPYPDLRLATGELAARLGGEEGREAFYDLLARLQPCKPGENFIGELFPRCRPPDSELDAVMDEALPILQAELPDDLSLQAEIDEGKVDKDALAGMESLRQVYSIFVAATWAAWPVCAALLGLVLLLAARSLDQALRWVGWPLLVAGGLALAGMGLTYAAAPSLVEHALAEALSDPAVPLSILELTGPLLTTLAQGVAGRGLLLAGGLAFLGLAAIVAALARRTRGQKDT